jgi:glycosyltransferase involved in cell wall biosynthesis
VGPGVSLTISVAMGTYNRAAMLREALEAALAQSQAPEEIVVADDASADGTREMLEALAAADPRVKVIRRETNSGGVVNCNAAMQAASGDLIAWCSDDDRFLPGHLEASAAFLEAHPETGLVHSGFTDAVETAEEISIEPRRLRARAPLIAGPRNLFGYLTRYYDWPFHPSTLVMRREVWQRVGLFDPAYALADTDWFVRAAGMFPTAMLPRHGVLNRRHRGNWSNRVGSARMQAEIFEIVERAMVRRWPRWRPERTFWRAAWRANVRLRLLLTLGARVRSGHGNAACAAWKVLLRHTGRSAPDWLERAGESLIRRWTGAREPRFKDARRSVSPL